MPAPPDGEADSKFQNLLKAIDSVNDELQKPDGMHDYRKASELLSKAEGVMNGAELSSDAVHTLTSRGASMFGAAYKLSKRGIVGATSAMTAACVLMSANAAMVLEDAIKLQAAFGKTAALSEADGDLDNANLCFAHVRRIFRVVGGERAFATAFGTAGGVPTTRLSERIVHTIDAALGQARIIASKQPDDEDAQVLLNLLRRDTLPLLVHAPNERGKVARATARHGIELLHNHKHDVAVALLREAVDEIEHCAEEDAKRMRKEWHLYLALAYIVTLERGTQPEHEQAQNAERAKSCIAAAQASEEPDGLLLLVKLYVAQDSRDQAEQALSKLLKRADCEFSMALSATNIVVRSSQWSSCDSGESHLVALYDQLSTTFPQHKSDVQLVLYVELVRLQSRSIVQAQDHKDSAAAQLHIASEDAESQPQLSGEQSPLCALRDAFVQMHTCEDSPILSGSDLNMVIRNTQVRAFQLYKAEQWELASPWFDALVKLTEGEAQANAHRSCSHCWLKLRDPERAMESAKQSLNSDGARVRTRTLNESLSSQAVLQIDGQPTCKSATCLLRTMLFARKLAREKCGSDKDQTQASSASAEDGKAATRSNPPVGCGNTDVREALGALITSSGFGNTALCFIADEASNCGDVTVLVATARKLIERVHLALRDEAQGARVVEQDNDTWSTLLSKGVTLGHMFRVLLDHAATKDAAASDDAAVALSKLHDLTSDHIALLPRLRAANASSATQTSAALLSATASPANSSSAIEASVSGAPTESALLVTASESSDSEDSSFLIHCESAVQILDLLHDVDARYVLQGASQGNVVRRIFGPTTLIHWLAEITSNRAKDLMEQADLEHDTTRRHASRIAAGDLFALCCRMRWHVLQQASEAKPTEAGSPDNLPPIHDLRPMLGEDMLCSIVCWMSAVEQRVKFNVRDTSQAVEPQRLFNSAESDTTLYSHKIRDVAAKLAQRVLVQTAAFRQLASTASVEEADASTEHHATFAFAAVLADIAVLEFKAYCCLALSDTEFNPEAALARAQSTGNMKAKHFENMASDLQQIAEMGGDGGTAVPSEHRVAAESAAALHRCIETTWDLCLQHAMREHPINVRSVALAYHKRISLASSSDARLARYTELQQLLETVQIDDFPEATLVELLTLAWNSGVRFVDNDMLKEGERFMGVALSLAHRISEATAKSCDLDVVHCQHEYDNVLEHLKCEA